MKGIIALDIDGTLTGPDHIIDQEVIDYLELLHSQQWQFIFISGRPYSWGVGSLTSISFPYFLAIYNGAYLISMPDKLIAERHLLDRSIFKQINGICSRFSTGCVIYGGVEQQEKIYYTPSKFDEETLRFFEERRKVTLENWIDVANLDDIPLERFTSLKFFAKEAAADNIADAIESELGLHIPLIQDPVDPAYKVLQATHPRANKGDALESFAAISGWAGIRIAAGNDINDLSMFKRAQFTIAMQDSPLILRQMATVVAPSVENGGLITALKTIIEKHERTR